MSIIYKETQSGRSMIEMLGVLAVIGVLTVGGFSLVNKVSTAHRSNVLIDEIGVFANKTRVVFHEYLYDQKKSNSDSSLGNQSRTDIVAPSNPYISPAIDIRDDSSGRRGFSLDLSTSDGTGSGSSNSFVEYLYKAHSYPDSWEISEDKDYFITKDDVLVKAMPRSISNIDYFDIHISRLDEDMCMAITQTSWGSPSLNGFVAMCAGSNCSVDVITSKSNCTLENGCVRGGKKLPLDTAANACSNSGPDNMVMMLFR